MAAGETTRVPVVWYKYDVTLVLPSTPREIRERLARLLPRIAVPAGVGIPRFGLSWSRYYLGALAEDRLTLRGPYGRGRRSIPELSVQGSLESSAAGGTLMRLSASPARAILGVFLLCASGVIAGVLVAALERVTLLPVGLVILFSLLGVAFYSIARLSAFRRLQELLECLDETLSAK